MANHLEELPAVEILKTEVKVVNNLNDGISEVQVSYGESNKGRGTSYLYNYKTVDIESEESINWKNDLKFGAIPSRQDAVSDENVYFGNNRGYWQVYFRYKGNDYKINKNNANFNLEKRDQNEPVVIEILDHRKGIYANFEVPSGKDYFWMQRGSPLERGVSVVIRSELRAEVSEVRLVYAESTVRDVDIETEKNIVSMEEVSFDNRTLRYKEEIRSTNRLVFSYHSSFWQLYFNHDGNFHKLDKNDARFNLKSDDNGKRLLITIGHQAEPFGGIPVTFSMSSRTREFSTMTEVLSRIRRMRCQQLRVTLSSAPNFDQLKNVRNDIKQIIGQYPRDGVGDCAFGYSRLFFRNPDCAMVTDEPSKLKFSHELYYKEEMISSLCKLQKLLQEETRLSGILREQLNEVERLSAGQVEIARTDTQFLYGIGVVCGEITLVGINQLGLIVRVGAIVECGLNLEEFEKALDDETLLLDLCLMPVEPETEEAAMLQIQICLSNAFLREFDKYETITRGTIKLMREIASALHGNTRDVAIAKGTGGVAGVAGGVLLVVGLALEPVTLGTSTALVISGIAMMAASGALNIGTAIGDVVARRIIIAQLKQSLNEKVLFKTLSSLTELIGTASVPMQEVDPNLPVGNELAKKFSRYVGNAEKFGVVGLAVGLKLAGRGGVQVLRNAFRFSAVAVSIVFDLATVFDSTFTLATGAKSNLGYKWAYNTVKLEGDLIKTRKIIDEYIQKR